MAVQDKQVNVRVNPELIEWLKEYAKASHRSLTAQLAMILEQERQRVQATAPN